MDGVGVGGGGVAIPKSTFSFGNLITLPDNPTSVFDTYMAIFGLIVLMGGRGGQRFILHFKSADFGRKTTNNVCRLWTRCNKEFNTVCRIRRPQF